MHLVEAVTVAGAAATVHSGIWRRRQQQAIASEKQHSLMRAARFSIFLFISSHLVLLLGKHGFCSFSSSWSSWTSSSSSTSSMSNGTFMYHLSHHLYIIIVIDFGYFFPFNLMPQSAILQSKLLKSMLYSRHKKFCRLLFVCKIPFQLKIKCAIQMAKLSINFAGRRVEHQHWNTRY